MEKNLMKDTRGKAWTVFFSVIMVLSMITMSVTLVGTVAAETTQLDNTDVEDVAAGQTTQDVDFEVTFGDRDGDDEEDKIAINVEELHRTDVAVTAIEETESGSGDLYVGEDVEEVKDADDSDADAFENVEKGDRIALLDLRAAGSGATDPVTITATLNIDTTDAEDPETLSYHIESEKGGQTTSGSFTAFAGSGTEDDPYKISNWSELAEVNDDPAADYILMNELNDSTEGYDTYASTGAKEDKGWDPLGEFSGTFDGQGYAINGLNINREDDTENGLFGIIADDGVVRNVSVINVDFAGQNKMGGVAGLNKGTIETSYSTGMVDGGERTGGLVGHSDGGEITNSYSTVEVRANNGNGEKIGGLVGDNSNSDITNSYSTGLVKSGSDDSQVGGLTGREDGTTNVENSFWDTETSGQSSSGGGTGLTTAQMQDYNSFTDESNDGLDAAWDFVGTENDDAGTDEYWEMDQDGRVNDNYPILTWQDGADGTLSYTFSGGSGTEDDPYEISNWDDLAKVTEDDYFVLVNNISSETTGYDDYASSEANDGNGWDPIADFDGSFDGQEYEIRDLHIDREGEDYIGLFGNITGDVKRVGVTNIDVSGGNRVGGLVGFTDENGDIEDSHATGNVSGDDNVGGLVGYIDEGGYVYTSYAAVDVTGKDNVGGFFGLFEGTDGMSGSYATGSVAGENYVGGFIGKKEGGDVKDSYSTGEVTGEDHVGGFAGDNVGGDIVNSFWDTTTSGQGSSGGDATGKTTAEMQNIATYSEWTIEQRRNYDANTDWFIQNGTDYPRLSWEPLPPVEIDSWKELEGISNNLTDEYVLTTDLDKDDTGDSTDWDSIGTFEGTFDGQGHTIANLSGSNGLFSKIDGATIENVTLDDVDVASESNQIGGLVGTVEDTERSTISGVNVTGTVNGETETGGLIGYNSGADIKNSSATGSIPDGEGGKQGGLVGYEAGGNNYTDVYAEMDVSLDYGEENDVGGLIGLFDDSQTGGSITGAYAIGDILGENRVGGLIGNNRGADITDSYATGTIPGGEGSKVGGLVGYEIGSNTYTRVYATGNVSPEHNEETNIGGLIGHFDSSQTGGSVTDSYATGDVYGDSYLGGLIGQNNGADITNAYSTGWVRDRDYSGGLTGSDDGGSYSNAFWDTNTSEQDDSAGGTAKTTEEMNKVATFTDSDTDGLDDPWDFVGNPNDDEGEENIWNIGGATNDGYPYLEQLADADPASVSGDVFEGDDVTRVSDGTVEIYFYQQNDSGDADETADLDDGSYSFDGLGADDYHLVVTGATDHQDDERNISLNAGESATENFTLTEITVVDSISVDTPIDTLDYDSGDALNLSGLVINETLSDGTTETTAFDDAGWSNYTAVPADGDPLADSDDGTNVTVTHTDSGETTDTSTLTVNTVVDSISVETQPDTLTYDSGDALDLTGLVINETLSDGTTDTMSFDDADWSEYTADPSNETTLEGSDDGSPVTVTHTDSGNTADTDPLTVNTVVESISVETQPNLTYDSGDALDLTGMEVTETYSDGSTATVTYDDSDWDSNYSVDPSDETTLEDADDGSTVTVTHTDSGETADTDPLTVNAVVESISVETQPNLTYDSGEALNLTGMEVTETYTDDSTATVTYDDSDWDSNYSVDTSDETTLEDSDDGSTVTVTHTDAGETADTDVLTVNAVVDSISVETQPNLTYDSGESLNLSGMVINETLSDGTTDTTSFDDADWSEYTADPSDGTTLEVADDGSTVTVTHTNSGETADTNALTVNVVVDYISVETQPNLTYDSGEALDLSGMEVTETYSDGSTSTVTYGDNNWGSDYSADSSDGTTLEDSDDGGTVTVTHTDVGETADTDVLTVNAVVDSISVETQPNLTYDSGESLNLSGIEVTETYSDGSTSTVTYGDSDWDSDYSVDPSDGTVLEEGDDGSTVTVTHTDSGETAGTDTLTVNTDGDGSDGADSIAIQTEPDGTQTAGETLTSPPKVSVTDEHGNAVEGVDVTVTENSDYSFDSGTTTQTTGSDGVATFDDLVIETAGTSYELNFSISSGDHNVTAGDTASSQTFEVESAAADAITIQTQPDVIQIANETLTGLPAVNVTDEHGNAVEGTNVTVALKPVGDPQDFGYNSTLTVLTNESGIATFDNLVVNTTTGDYRLEFNVNPSVTSEIFSMEAATDTTPPEITNFSVNNTEGQTVEVSFDSDKELSKINSNGTDDADGTNLVMSNFTQSGNLTNGFTYTATLSENEGGTFGATLDTAEDANDNDGASDESDSVMIDTSNDGDGSSGGSGGDGSSGGSGGDGSSGGSGGDGSSGGSGGDGSSGGNGNSNNETDTGDNQSQSVTRQPSTDGSIGFAVSDSDGAGNILLSLTDEADDATEEPTGRNVDHDSLSVQPTETGTREFNISVHQWDASSETNESTNDRFFEGTGSSAIGYVEVTHSNPDDDIEGVTFQFRVQSAYLDEHDIESEDIALYRDETGGWNELDATEVETTDTHHVFEAESPGLSLFAVGAPDSTEPTSGPDAVATVSPSVVTVGEEVTLDGSDSTNEDGEITAYNWSVNGETITGETVTVTTDEPGEYTVELTVTNDAGETDTTVTDLTVTAGEDTSDNGLPTTTDDETPVGFGIYAIIALLVVVIIAVIAWGVRRRRSEDDDSIW